MQSIHWGISKNKQSAIVNMHAKEPHQIADNDKTPNNLPAKYMKVL